MEIKFLIFALLFTSFGVERQWNFNYFGAKHQWQKPACKQQSTSGFTALAPLHAKLGTVAQYLKNFFFKFKFEFK